MALEFGFVPKKEEKMARYKLEARYYLVGEGDKQKVMREEELKSIKDGRLPIRLLGGVGSEIEMELAQKLGLLKPAKKDK